MKEAIGGTWLFQIVIAFILLFTGFMCLTINRSKAFNVKDQIIQSIQSYNGIDLGSEYKEGKTDAFEDIVYYLNSTSYRNTGVVPEDGNYSCYSKNGTKVDSRPVFCIEAIHVESNSCPEGADCFNELPDMIYYRVVVFYQLDLPIFHDLFNFRVVGDTKLLYGGSL